MKCVIIAGGDMEHTPQTTGIIQNAQMIVCADSGAGHLRPLNILPDIIIGDFDSIDPDDRLFYETNHVTLLSFPRKKDQTDSELCIKWAMENKATDITFLGATGSRLDHTLSNILLLRQPLLEDIPARIINANNEIFLVENFMKLEGVPGELISILPIMGRATGVTLKGFEYPLTNAVMEMGSSLGISNVFKEPVASVSLKTGMLVITKSKD